MIQSPINSLASRLENAHASVKRQLLDHRNDCGHWVGELSASALSTATAISALSLFQNANPEHEFAETISRQIDTGFQWLLTHQNSDGGWGDTDQSYSNISTSMLVIAAINAAGRVEQYRDAIDRAQAYVTEQGGVDAIRKRYGADKTFAVPILANCAMAGILDWSEVSALPFEAACVPQRFYNLMQMPVVSYAVPALVAIGQAKFFADPPRNPVTRTIRRAAVGRSLNALLKMQPASGGYLEAVPLTSFVSMALIHSGRADHPVVQNGVQFILDSYRDEGTWPIDTNLATWCTTLSINAMASDGTVMEQEADWSSTLDWLLSCQYQTVHPFTGAAPGGWGWSDLSGSVPDADDSPGALLALANLNDRVELDASQRQKIQDAAEAGVGWLLGLQNRDSGWPTFCRGWGKFPFDRSGTDITAHVIRGLSVWKSSDYGENLARRIEKAIKKGFVFLTRNQSADGSWNPLWFGNQDTIEDLNPCYGTAKVLLAYVDENLIDTPEAQKGLNWIMSSQNRDGGWGGGKSREWSNSRLGISSVEETALCVEALVAANRPDDRDAIERGVEWLVQAVESNLISECWPIGFYFAKLWYYEKLYPLIFATGALGAVRKSGMFESGSGILKSN